MNVLMNTIKRDLNYLINIKNISLSIIIFIIITLFTLININNFKSDISFLDFIILNLGGITIEYINALNFLKWFLPIILFTFFIVNFIYKEWDGRYIYSLIRIKSMNIWIFSKIFSLTFFSILYVSLYYIILAIFYNIFNVSSFNIKNLFILTCTFVLMCLLFMVISLITILLSLLLKESTHSYLIICAILIEPFFQKIIPIKFLPFLIGENGMIARHNLSFSKSLNLSFKWSFIYFLLTYLLLIILITFTIKRKDFN